MKKISLLLVTVFLFSLSWSCSDDDSDGEQSRPSELLFKVTKTVHNPDIQGEIQENDSIIFTGDDILWFNETTGEIRFKRNYTIEEIVTSIPRSKVKICIGDQSLFTVLSFITDVSSEEIDEPVLYYNTLDIDDLDDNRFYLADGYPQWDWLTKDHPVQIMRDENMKKIEPEWTRFIEQLKKEGKYRK